MRGSSLLLSGLVASVLATAAMAQTSVDRSFTTVSKDCPGIQWSAEALKAYPNIATACQAVEERNGKTYVKFAGRVERNINDGEQLKINFRDGGTLTLSPPANTTLYVNGKQTPVANLQRGDSLQFYVPEDQFVAQVAENETPQTQYVVVPIVYREVIREEPEQAAAVLPDTAGELPLVALSGLMLLGLGAGLSIARMKK
jgi:hypothetical protein